MRPRSPTRESRGSSKDDGCEIYVGNINGQTNVKSEDLKRLFSIAGHVSNVRIERKSEKDTHFAFIAFSTPEEAEQGCLFDGFKYHALSLKVERKGRHGPPKAVSPPNEEFMRKLRELQEQENTDLYLTNVNTADASEEILRETFSEFGQIRRVHLHGCPNSPSRPAFITFSRPEQVQRAVDAMDGKEFLGHTLGVCKARVGNRFGPPDTSTSTQRRTATSSSSSSSSESEKKRASGKGDKADKADKLPAAEKGTADSTERRRASRKAKEDGKPAAASTAAETKAAAPEKSSSANADKASTSQRAALQSRSSQPQKEKPLASTTSSSTATTSNGVAAKPSSSAAATTTTTTAATTAVASSTAARTSEVRKPSQPTRISTPPEDPSNPEDVISAVTAGLEATRVCDRAAGIGPHCSTDPSGVPTFVLPAGADCVVTAIHTVAKSIQSNHQKAVERARDGYRALEEKLEEVQRELETAREDMRTMEREMLDMKRNHMDDVERLQSKLDSGCALRFRLSTLLPGTDLSQMCASYGTVLNTACIGDFGYVTFMCSTDCVTAAPILKAELLRSAASVVADLDMAYHQHTISPQQRHSNSQDGADRNISPLEQVLGVFKNTHIDADDIPPTTNPIVPILPCQLSSGSTTFTDSSTRRPEFPQTVVGSGLNPNAEAYKLPTSSPPANSAPSLPLTSSSLPHSNGYLFVDENHLEDDSPEGVCAYCGKMGQQLCSVCMCTYYCGEACQEKHWPSHMNQCEELAKLAGNPSVHSN